MVFSYNPSSYTLGITSRNVSGIRSQSSPGSPRCSSMTPKEEQRMTSHSPAGKTTCCSLWVQMSRSHKLNAKLESDPSLNLQGAFNWACLRFYQNHPKNPFRICPFALLSLPQSTSSGATREECIPTLLSRGTHMSLLYDEEVWWG